MKNEEKVINIVITKVFLKTRKFNIILKREEIRIITEHDKIERYCYDYNTILRRLRL